MTIVRSARSTKDVLEHCLEVAGEWSRQSEPEQPEIWYRGLSSNQYGLIPSAYRKPGQDAPSLLATFQCLAPSHFTNTRRGDDWDDLFTAQHYGLPTRLLDWSESLATALFFAVAHAEARQRPTPPVKGERGREQRRNPTSRDRHPPCIWVIDAATLNTITTDEYSVVVPGDTFTEHWLPWKCAQKKPNRFKYKGDTYTNRGPLAIYPRRSTPRIVAQSGVFTMHGADPRPIDQIFGGAKKHLRRIMRIDLIHEAKIAQELRLLGTSRFTLFPEPQEVAQHVLMLHGL